MTTSRKGAMTGSRRRRRNTRARQKHTVAAHALFWIALSALVATALLAPAYAGPELCETDGTKVTCIGDQSKGIQSGTDFVSPPVTTLNVHSLATPIAPVLAGADGIKFISGRGLNVTINSGTSEDTVAIDTTAAGNNAVGIYATSTGSSPAPSDDPFLGIPIPGTPESAGGDVTINSYSDISTMGTYSHGIYAKSSTTGYPPSVKQDLEDFIVRDNANNTGIAFSVSSVGTIDGSDNVGSTVAGTLTNFVPQLGCDPLADPECRLDPDDIQTASGSGGTFTIDEQGNFTFVPDEVFESLQEGESFISEVDFWLTGTRGSHTESGIQARLVARVTKTEDGYDINYQTIFDTEAHDYGVQLVEPGTDTVFPDLGTYVQGLIDSLSNGEAGNSVIVNHFSGEIVTDGFEAHGIFGESHGVNGGNGQNGGGFFSFGTKEPTGGHAGTDGGMVSITVDGDITTKQDNSLGVFAYGRGGKGGKGGNGGTYYGGRRGGYGGDGGNIYIYGSGKINTAGAYSSGILAFSEGGIGGKGGDGGDWEGGARGGYGGDAGDIEVIGDWSITTGGDMAHGIWAKSLGGSAGNGGSDGWLRGGPGGGGLAADGGTVVVESGGTIHTKGIHSYGIHAQSIGGFGGSGGQGIGIFASSGGDGGSAGMGGTVEVRNLPGASITTENLSAHGIFAQSVGGGGGSGGGSGGLFYSEGGAGGAGGHGGNVLIENSGLTETFGLNAHGVFGQSVGGGGGDGGFAVAIVGSGGSGSMASNSGLVEILNAGEIFTHNDLASGVYAQSIGGGGGSGGASAGLVSIGGSAGGGGNGAPLIDTNGDGVPDSLGIGVDVENTGTIMTAGSTARGIFAQSVGGGGGDGGFAGGVAAALGGKAGTAGHGGQVVVDNAGGIYTGFDIETGEALEAGADFSQGIFAQSVGGGGGSGGGSVGIGAALGGKGGAGGRGGNVTVTNAEGGLIATNGIGSDAIFAQSIGGGGGSSGFSAGYFASIGGSAGTGSEGGNIDVDNFGELWTRGDFSVGVFAQSIGGGGGNASGSGGWFASIGGSGGEGGAGGMVDVLNAGQITTFGDGSHSIFAQSVGGGGGNGGSSLAFFASVGGTGGTGSEGGTVDVVNSGTLTTMGNNSFGIFAQSVGGGGGSGGNATTVNIAPIVSIGFALGGEGGDGSLGGNVTVTNEESGDIFTNGANSHGVFAQSVGGGGGNGGSATTISATMPIETPYGDLPAIQASIAIGGQGGGGGDSGTVKVDNDGQIVTGGFRSYGVYAQSVGGDGGDGGNATSVTLGIDTSFTASVAVGGGGGDAGDGYSMIDTDGDGEPDTALVGAEVNNSGLIHTQGDYSTAVFAQSVGGGGGSGGDATTINMQFSTPPTSWDDLVPMPSGSFTVAVGGNGGAAGDGGEVIATNSGNIITEGDFAPAVMAQSVGGGGGSGGDARSISIEVSGDPMDYLPLMDLTSLSTTMVFGGDGAGGGHGGLVTATHEGSILTTGAFSHGIVAQSVGGGGGNGGSAITIDISSTNVIPDIPVLSDISDLTTINMTLQGSGGAGGNGGNVFLNSNGDIWTEGDFAMGVVAQSVAGGGGMAGMYNPLGTTGSDFFDTMLGLLVETESGVSFFGSVGFDPQISDGPDGNSGNVNVEHAGHIQTLGDAAHGLLAQSVASAGTAGTVSVDYYGSIHAGGDYSYGLYAQSEGGLGNGAIEVNLFADQDRSSGPVMIVGGSGSGAGVFIAGGAENSIMNEGLITSTPGIYGYAIVSTGGNETVNNFGTLTGSVDLGFGDNAIFNDGMINSGLTYNLGGGYLVNAGHFAIGGIGNLFSTDFVGDFEQTETGTLWYDLVFDYGADATDWLDISGGAWLDGTLGLILEDTGKVLPGHHEHVLITSWGGFDDPNLSLAVPASAVIDYSLAVTNPTDYTLAYDIDFAPAGLNRNQAALGEHINEIQLAGGTSLMEPLTAEIVAIPDVDLLADAYDMLSPTIYSANQQSRLFASLDFERSMHSCPVRDGDRRFSSEGSCNWMRVSDRNIEYEAEDGRLAATDYSLLINMGMQRAISDRWHFGFAAGFENIDYEIPLAAERTGTQVQVGGILKGRYGNNAFDFSLTAGRGEYDTERYTSMPVEGEFTVGSRGLNYAAAHAGYAYLFERKNWYLQPGVDLGWTTLSGNSFHESGSGPAALWVKHRDEEFFTSRAEIVFGSEFRSDSDTVYRPFARTAYTHILTGTTGKIHARLAGAPDEVGYFTQVLPFDDNFTSLAVGLDVFTGERWVMRFTYDRQFATSWDAESFFAKLIYGM